MKTLPFYLLRNVSVPFVLTTVVILLALSLERLLRLVDLIVSEGASISSAFLLLSYLQPHYLGLAVPAALFFSIMIGFRKMHEQSELVVMQSAGVPYNMLAKPALMFAAGLMVVMFLVSAYLQPIGRYSYRADLQDLKSGYASLRVKPSVFQKIDDNIIVRADRVSLDGQTLFGFFASVEEENGRRIILASRAVIVPPADLSHIQGADDRMTIVLHDGQIIREKDGQDPSLLSVNSYPWRLPLPPYAPYGVRGQDERELTFFELLDGGRDSIAHTIKPEYISAEIHSNLVNVLSLPILALLAIPLALMGAGRTGQAKGIVIGILILIIYEKTLGVSSALVRGGDLHPFFALWCPYLILMAVAIASFMRMAGLSLHDIFARFNQKGAANE